MGFLFKVSVDRCIACGKCELACSFAHGEAGRPATPRIRVTRRAAERGVPLACLQCDDAACEAACPTQAIARNPATGALEVHEERCVRCRACVAACPFGNLTWDELFGRVAKCDLCGGRPQCVPFCPAGALEWAPASACLPAL